MFFPLLFLQQIDHKSHLVREVIDKIVETIPEKDQREEMASIVNEFEKILTEAIPCLAGRIFLQNSKYHSIVTLVLQKDD